VSSVTRRDPPVRLTEPVVEVGAERPEFDEQGIAWKRVDGPGGAYVYAPAELTGELLSPTAYAALGLGGSDPTRA